MDRVRITVTFDIETYKLLKNISDKNIVEIRCFLLPKTYNFIHNHRLVQIPCVIF